MNTSDIPDQQESALILVVDDDKFTRIQLRRAMAKAGYQVVEASDGEQALITYTCLHPDIVLLDALMPVMDGFTCCTQLRSLPGGDLMPILMITALEDQESVDQAFDVGATDFITKPIHWAVLRQRVRRLLQASRATAALQQQTQRAQQSEAHLRLALEAAQMGTWDWDFVSGKITWSDNLEPLFGLAPGSFDGTYQSFITRVHAEDREFVDRAVHHSIEYGEEYNIEFRVVKPDGMIRVCASLGQVYYDATGKAVRMAGIDMDITKRQRIEQERDRFFTLSLDLQCIAGLDGFFKRLNPAWEKTLGYTQAELLAAPLLNFVHPEDQNTTTAEVNKLAKGVATHYFENRYRCKNGSYKWLAWTAFPAVEEQLIYAIARDVTERKHTEQERLQLLAREQAARTEAETARNRIRNILESITDGFFALDNEWRFTYLNRQAERLLQKTAAELLGKNVWDEFPEAVGSSFYQEYHKAVSKQVSVEFEEFFPPLDSWFGVHAYPAIDGLSVYFSDITERQQAQEKLQQTTMLQQAILESTNYTIISTTVDGTILTFNAAAERLLGYTASEVVGKVTPIIIHDSDEVVKRAQELSEEMGVTIEPGFEVFVAKARRGELDEREWTYIRKDGSRFPVLLSITPLVNAEGKITGFLGIGSDITERKRSQEELQRSQQRSQLFADITLKIRQSLHIEEILQTTVAEVQKLLHADRVLIFRLLSNGYGQIITEAVFPGFPSVLGQGITDDCFGEDYLKRYVQGRIYTINDINQAQVQPCLIEFMQQFDVKAKLVMPILLKEELWGLLIAHQCSSPRQWSSFEIDLLRQLADQIGIALAQAQLLEQETRQSQELARSNTELQQFASVASHDLQEPLRKIQAFGNRLKTVYGDTLDQQGRDYLERMQNAAGRMQNLIDDLLTLSRITTRAQPFVLVNLAEVTQEVLSDLEVRLQQTGGCVEVGELPTIEADLVQMRQLLQNLISNALKFHQPHSSPQVKIYSQLLNQERLPVDGLAGAEFCQIIVEDNGIGFDEKYLDRIFNVFQRLHSRSEYEGTGMGLTICRKIAERHHGSITATSQPGYGASFMVTLPIKHPRGENTE